jgi:hypothetical protein
MKNLSAFLFKKAIVMNFAMTKHYVLIIMGYLIQPTISLEVPVPSQGHYGFHSFPVVD